jgi:signal peptidase
MSTGCRLAVRALVLGYCGALLTLLIAANAARLIGWDPTVVLSGSMQPALRTGDVVLVAPVSDARQVAVGDIVTVTAPNQPGGTYLHRVVDVTTSGGLVTRGDANDLPDFPIVDPANVEGKVRLVLPLVGWPYAALRHGNPAPLLVAAWPSALVLISRGRLLQLSRLSPVRRFQR